MFIIRIDGEATEAHANPETAFDAARRACERGALSEVYDARGSKIASSRMIRELSEQDDRIRSAWVRVLLSGYYK